MRTLDDDPFFADPHAAYGKLRGEALVHRVSTPTGEQFWLVASHAEAKSALADPRLSKRPGGLSGVFLAMVNDDPPAHTRLRRLVSSAFTPAQVHRLRPEIERITAELLDQWPRHGVVDLMEWFATPLPFLVICSLLGIPEAHRQPLRDLLSRVMNTADVPRIRREALTRYMTKLISVRRRAPAEDDLLGRLIAARDDDDRLSEQELVEVSVLLFIAGHETTAHLIGNGVVALLRRPGHWAALAADPDLLPAAVEELLRFDGPLGRATLRVATEDMSIGSAEIKAGDVVSVGLASANRDEAAFGHAGDLDLCRGHNPHLAFGHGIHYCLGAPLARLQAQVAIGTLAHRHPRLRLAAPPRWVRSGFARGPAHLPVVPGDPVTPQAETRNPAVD